METSSHFVHIVRDDVGFDNLHDQWSSAAARSRAGPVFSSHEWFQAAWQWRAPGAQLFLACFVEGQRLTAVLPLVLSTVSKRGMRYRELSFLTVPDTQACDVVVSEEDSKAACVAFAAVLGQRQREWDVMRLKYLPAGSVVASGLRDALARRGFRHTIQTVTGNPLISLESTWDAYYATRSRRLKKANNLAASRIKKAGGIRIGWLAPGAGDASEIESFLQDTIAISARSWKRNTENSLDHAGPQAFIRRLSRLAHERGWLSIWILRSGERPVAMEYQLIADGCVHALRSDFDAEFEDVSPGTYLNRCLLEKLFGRGLTRYYMGPGDNAYKRRWTDESEAISELTVYGRTLRGRMLAAWESQVKPWIRKIRTRRERSPTGVSADDTEGSADARGGDLEQEAPR